MTRFEKNKTYKKLKQIQGRHSLPSMDKTTSTFFVHIIDRVLYNEQHIFDLVLVQTLTCYDIHTY